MAINVDISKITGINQVGNSYQRKSAVPLDYFSLFNSKALAEAYASSNPVSYVGQVISYIENSEVKVCVIADEAGTLKEVGTAPLGDEKTIEVSAEGAVSLLGAATAANGTLPMIDNETGKLVWKTLEDIGAGDGNDNTTYTFTLGEDGKSISIQAYFNGVAQGEAQVLSLDVYTKSEVNAAIKVEADRAAAAEKANADAIDAIEADYLKAADLNAYATTEYVDGQIEAVEEAIGKLNHFTTKIVTSTTEVTETGILYLIKDESVAGVDKYNEYLYIEGQGAVLIGDTTTDLSGYDTSEEVNAKVKVVQDAVDALEAIDNATQAELDAYKGEVTEALGLKANVADVYDKAATDSAIAEALKNATGGESAADVLLALNNYKKAVNLEVWGDENIADDAFTSTTSRIDTIETKVNGIEAGAEVNIIEIVKKNGTALTVGEDRSVDITVPTTVAELSDANDYAKQSALDTVSGRAEKGISDAAAAKAAADAAQETANGAATQASTNATAITGLGSRLTAAEGVGNTNTSAIAGQETRLAAAEGAIKTINDTSLPAKADKSVVDGLVTTVGTHTQEIAALGTNKADASAVYGKGEVYNKTEIDSKTGTIPEGSSLMAEIAKAQTAATYDDTEVKAGIKANTDAIAIINGEATVEGSIAKAKADALAAVATLEDGAVAGNTAAIAKLNGEAGTEGSVATIADARIAAALAGADTDFDTLKEMSDWLSTHKGSAAEMNTAITANTNAIAAINNESTGILATAKKYTDDEITALDLANTYEAKGAAATAEQNAKDYADGAIAALGMANYKVKEVVSGHEALTVSTDENGKVTVGFASEIILNGGSATIA